MAIHYFGIYLKLENMKKAFKRSLLLVLPLFGLMVFYLPTAFYFMDFNPNNWSQSSRAFIGMEGMLFVVLGLIVAFSFNMDLFKEQN